MPGGILDAGDTEVTQDSKIPACFKLPVTKADSNSDK